MPRIIGPYVNTGRDYLAWEEHGMTSRALVRGISNPCDAGILRSINMLTSLLY